MRREEMRSEADKLLARSSLSKSSLSNDVLAKAFPEPEKAAADPDPEVQKNDPGKKGRRIRKIDLEEKYARQTYWIRKEYIQKVQDYAFTEDINLRQAINRLLLIAFDEVEKQYQKEGKELLHFDERNEYQYDYLQ